MKNEGNAMQWFTLQTSEVQHIQGLRSLTPIQRELILQMVTTLCTDVTPTMSIVPTNVSPLHKAPDRPPTPISQTAIP